MSSRGIKRIIIILNIIIVIVMTAATACLPIYLPTDLHTQMHVNRCRNICIYIYIHTYMRACMHAYRQCQGSSVAHPSPTWSLLCLLCPIPKSTRNASRVLVKPATEVHSPLRSHSDRLRRPQRLKPRQVWLSRLVSLGFFDASCQCVNVQEPTLPRTVLYLNPQNDC